MPVSFLFYTFLETILSFQLMKFLCCLSYVGKVSFKASERLKIIQVVPTIEFTKAPINMDKGMSLNYKNPEFDHLISSAFQSNPSKYCSKTYTVCWETKLEKNEQWGYFYKTETHSQQSTRLQPHKVRTPLPTFSFIRLFTLHSSQRVLTKCQPNHFKKSWMLQKPSSQIRNSIYIW